MDDSTRRALARAVDDHQRGATTAAEAAYRALYAQHAHPEIAHLLAIALHQQRRFEESLPWFERARAGASLALHVNYAAALLALNRGREAEAESRLALALAPGHAGARLNLALALAAQQRFGAAAADFSALAQVPETAAAARRGLVRCLLVTGQPQAARAALAADRDSADPESILLRGEVELHSGQLDAAQAALDVAAAAGPTRERAWLLQARLAQKRCDSSAALRLLDRALAGDPGNRAALLQSVPLLLERGEVPTCLTRLQAWLAAHPLDAGTHSLYLRCAQFAPEFDAARLLLAHRRWAALHAVPAEFVAPRRRSEGEPLRIGWLSPLFRHGPVQTLLRATLLELGQRGLAHNVLYSCDPRRDASSAVLRAAGEDWEDVADLDDAALVQRVRADRIDVLVDLAGHAQDGRLTALARRAAPVQVTWMDSFGTTGIDAMDFILTDPVSSPPGSESGFVEGLLFMPRSRFCYEPPVPAQQPDPAARRLISLNHFAKINAAVLAVWAEILRALPDWTLFLQSQGGDDPAVVERLRSRFAQEGVDPLRIECAGYAPVAQALAAYRHAAIALDPFPYGGGVTSCDALWMGLPLVTWPHDTLISRQGASLLRALGQGEWIARDAKEYVAIACRLAADPAARASWSAAAARRVAEHLGDPRRFAGELRAALDRAWSLRAGEGFAAVSRRT
jgi:predicted O-linked N-acetylglucosamine transferase (SPINDLY family)